MALIFSGSAAPLSAANPALTEAGEAIKKNKHAAAVKTLNKALKSRKLSTADMSKALYYRGIAYRALNKPAQAIADLTNAIWLGGLTPGERVDALKQRARAYEAGGVSGRAKSDIAEANRLARNVPQGGVASIPRPATAAKTSGGGGLTSGFGNIFGNIFGGSSKGITSTSNASAPAVSSIAQGTTSAVTTTPGGNPVPVVRNKAKPKPAPVTSGWSTNINQVAQKKADSAPKSSGGAGSFFGNWFGGSSKPKPAAPKAVPKSAPGAIAGQWSTQTAALAVKKPAKRKVKRKARRAAGRYKLQIATVRSRKEASSIVSKLSARHGSVVSRHPARIDEAVMGNMGTFYRVRLEAFASEKSALKTCNRLRASGLDCFPVAR